jgi:LiaI-LiaF-like transmembrane region
MSADNLSLIRAIRGPVTLITAGGLFAIDHFSQFSFHQTWPVLLIVFGLLSLIGRSASSGGSV